MATAPTKLGQFVQQNWSEDDALLRSLRQAGLVRRSVSDDEVMAVIRQAREENQAISESVRHFSFPHERVRLYLQPYLTAEGRTWSLPRNSRPKPWWKFWS